MSHREKLKGGYEYDLVSICRKRGNYSNRNSKWKKIKRKINKRIRSKNKLKIKKEIEMIKQQN